METRKNGASNIETKRPTAFVLGLLVALGLSLVALEWRQADLRETALGDLQIDDDFIEEMAIVKPKVAVPKPPAPKPKPSPLPPRIDPNPQPDPTPIDPVDPIDPDLIDIPEPPEPPGGTVETEVPFVIVEQMPEYPGGEEALFRFLSENTRYPTMARDAGIKGRVYLQFVVAKDGSITNIELLRGIGGGCDEEAIRVVGKMPKWIPGEQAGKKVPVIYRLPFNFITK